jgi:pheromone shutdown protein TraB
MVAFLFLKLAAVPFAAGLAATGLGFLFLWPKSGREAAARFACTLLACTVAGPCLAVAAYCWWPGLFASAGAAAALAGGPAELGVLLVAAPFLVLAGLPAWWILGALLLWFERRRSKDIAEIAHDAAKAVRQVRKTL